MKTRRLFVAAMAVGSVVVARAAALSDQSYMRMGAMSFEPKVDAVISREEMRHSSNQYGPISDQTKLMTFRYGAFYFGYTEKGFYFAARTSAPTRPIKYSERDAVTLWLQPPQEKKPCRFRVSLKDASGDLPVGSVARSRRLKGVTDYGVECVETELFVPYSAKLPRPKDGETWGLQMSVDYSAERETGWWHLPSADGELGTFVVDASAPVVGIKHFSAHETRRYNNIYRFTLAVDNPGAASHALSSTSELLRGITFSKLDDGAAESAGAKRIACRLCEGATIKSGEHRDFTHSEWSIWPGTVNRIVFDVKADGKPWFRRTVRWEHERGKMWKDTVGLPTLDAGFYPTRGNLLRAHWTGGKVAGLVRGGLALIDSEGRRTVLTTFSPNELKEGRFEGNLPDLGSDDYRVRLAVATKDGTVYTDERTFSNRQFVWEKLDLGKERIVVPPFTPIKVAGERIEFLQTGYHVSGMLWNEVYAGGGNILAAPVELKLNGRTFDVVSSRIVSADPDRVVREVRGKLDSLNLRVTQVYDYDGFCHVTLAVDASEEYAVDSFVLEMPLKAELSKQINYLFRAKDKRGGPAPDLSLPEGEGEIWTSERDVGEGHRKLMPNEVAYQPYVWWGDRELGFCWLFDSFKDMSFGRRQPMQRLVRRNGAATMTCAFVSKRTMWKGKRTFTMGFQPTPVKPQHWELQRSAHNMVFGYLCPSNALSVWVQWKGAHGNDDLLAPIGSYPADDLSLVKLAQNGKKKDNAAYAREMDMFLKRNAKWFDEFSNETPADFKMRNNLGAWEMGHRHRLYYLNPEIISCYWPEFEKYKAEWSAFEWPESDTLISEYHGAFESSRFDKILYDGLRAMLRGCDGLYYDCFGINNGFNITMHPDECYRLPNGQVQLNVGDLLRERELVKRSAVLSYLHGKRIAGTYGLMIHTTDCQVVPVVSLATTAVNCERSGNGGDYQERFKESYMLADVLCLQSGLVPATIVKLQVGDMPRREHELKTLFAHMCAYGYFYLADQGILVRPWFEKLWNAVFDFGWGRADVAVHRFFDRSPAPVAHTGKDVRLTVAAQKDAALLMFGNLGEEAEVAFDLSGLRFGKVRMTDVLTGLPVDAAHVKIERHGFALIRVDRMK